MSDPDKSTQPTTDEAHLECRYCGTSFHPLSPYSRECPALSRHEARCRTASEEKRAFYAKHRRWQ